MNPRFLFTLPLAAALIVPAAAQQQGTANTTQPAASSSSSQDYSSSQAPAATPSQDGSASDQNMSAHQPLQPEMRQGFWGKLNPMARKKYVQRQLSPVRNRVNELDDLTAANAREIKDVDARAQQGIKQASDKANLADQHATDAGNRAQQANQVAMQASNRLNTVEQVVGNIDQYTPATQTEIRFRPGQTALSAKAKDALDDMTGNLKDQKGYIIEVQGFSASRGQAGIQSSQSMANSVVRYLVEKKEIPVYRIYVMGMGNARMPAADTTDGKAPHGNRVEISLLKNNVDQLASAQSQDMGTASTTTNSSYGNSSNTNSSNPGQPANYGGANPAATNNGAPSQPQH